MKATQRAAQNLIYDLMTHEPLLITKLNLKFLLFAVGLFSGYFLLLHTPLQEWQQQKTQMKSLKQQLADLNPRPDPANPLQHDPLIHVLIKTAQSHHLELINVQFNKADLKHESFACELRGSYLNIKEFLQALFNSSYHLRLKELHIRNEASNSYLKSNWVFEHEF